MADAPKAFELTSFEQAAEAVDLFEKVLLSNGVHIANGSELEHACLVLKQLLDHHLAAKRGEAAPEWKGFRDDLQKAIGVLNLVQLVIEHSARPEFAALVPHLKLLSLGAPSQTSAARATDQPANKIFELRLALACLRAGRELEFDDPVKSSGGRNPDVLCRMRDGRVWGFACKVIHGDAPMSLFELFESGVHQIDNAPRADVGLVIVSLKNRIPHAGLFPVLENESHEGVVLGAHPDWRYVSGVMSRLFQERVDAMVKHVGLDPVADLLRMSKALPGIACPLETVIGVTLEGRRFPTILSGLHTIRLDWGVPKRLDETAEGVLEDLNAGLAIGRPR